MLSQHKACICLKNRDKFLLATEEFCDDLKIFEPQIFSFVLHFDYFKNVADFSLVLKFQVLKYMFKFIRRNKKIIICVCLYKYFHSA